MEVQLPAGRNTGTALIFGIDPIFSGMDEATKVKFGRNIHRVHPNKRPLKIFEKREHGHIQGPPKVFGYPLLSQERAELHTSNFVAIFTASVGRKAH